MRLTIYFLFFFLICSCETKSVNPVYNASQLEGAWVLKFDGRYPYWFSQLAFTTDGRKCVLSYEFDSSGQVSIDYYLNRYEVKNGHLISTVGYSSNPYLLAGDVIKDRIERLHKNTFDVFMVGAEEGYTLEEHQRLSGVNPETICKVVEDHLLHKKSSLRKISLN